MNTIQPSPVSKPSKGTHVIFYDGDTMHSIGNVHERFYPAGTEAAALEDGMDWAEGKAPSRGVQLPLGWTEGDAI